MASTLLSFTRLPQQQTSPQAIGGMQPTSQYDSRHMELQAPSAAVMHTKMTEEYHVAEGQLAEQLELCGVQKETLSSKARLNLHLLASMASTLQLAEARPELILGAWAVLVLKESKASTLKYQLQQERDAVQQKHAAVRAKCKVLQQVLQDVQSQQKRWAADVAKNAKVMLQMREKNIEYRKQQQALQKRLDANGFTPELTHAALLAKHETVTELQQRLEELQGQLQEYHNLPPSVLGAQICLQEAGERLKQQQAKLEAKIADMH